MSIVSSSSNAAKKKKGMATEIDKIAGAVFREYRTSFGYIQSDVADKLGISFQQLQKYESGKNRMSLGFIIKSFLFFKINIEDFFNKIISSMKQTSVMEKRSIFSIDKDENVENYSTYEDNYGYIYDTKDIIRFMHQYHKLNKIQKRKILALIKSMTN